jgi:hypothetical protein
MHHHDYHAFTVHKKQISLQPSSFGALGTNVEPVPHQVVLRYIVSIGGSW